MERRIRNSAKALIFRGDCMAAVKIDDGSEVFYVMPGGGQESKELVFVVEGMRGETFHRVDLVFLCEHLADIPDAKMPATRIRSASNGRKSTNWKGCPFIPPSCASRS